jgi:hypothetical protein
MGVADYRMERQKSKKENRKAERGERVDSVGR